MAKVPSPKKGPAKKDAGIDVKREIEELRERNRELEETIEAIQSGEVDAIIVGKDESRQVYTLEGADHPYRALVENIREGALTISRSGTILYTNTRFAEMAKLPAEKVVGSSLIDHVCPDQRAEMKEALTNIAKRPCRSRLRIRQGEKGSLPVLISMNILGHGDDTRVSVVVTDRRKDEDRIMMQARMLDAVGDAVIAADMKNKIIYWNDAATRTYGWTPEEAIGRDLVEVATPVISHKEAREIADRLKKGETWSGEYVVKHRDGHEFPIYASDAPIFDDDGKLIAIIGASHDISDRKRMDAEVRRLLASVQDEKERLSSLVNSISDEIWFADTKENFTLANPAALREFAMSDGNAGIDIRKFAASLEVFRPDGTPRPVEEAPPLRALKGEVVTEEEMIRTPGRGELRYRQVKAAPVKSAGGEIIGSVAVVRDITARKKIEDELKKKHDDLHAAYEEITSTQEELRQNVEELTSREHQLNDALAEKEVLLFEIHHRVKNNLTAFISLLSLEGSTEETPAGRALKKDLQNRARSMALIHETLYRTRKFADVDMKEYLTTLVSQVFESYRSPQVFGTHIEIETISLDISRATPLGLIVNELVTNSLKYAFPKGNAACGPDHRQPCGIIVSLTREDGMILLRVADNGTGLPPGFDITTAKTLGLKLVYFLARHQLKATVGVITKNGTEFVFRFREEPE